MKRVYQHSEPRSSIKPKLESKPPILHQSLKTEINAPALFVRTFEGNIVHLPVSTYQNLQPQPIVIPKTTRKYIWHRVPIYPQKFEIVRPEITVTLSQMYHRRKTARVSKRKKIEPKEEIVPIVPRKPPARCALCSRLLEQETDTLIESEKLIVLWAWSVSHELIKTESMETHFCDSHFSEAVEELFRALRVSCPDEIARCEESAMDELSAEMSRIGGSEMKSEEFRMELFRFADKYWNPFEHFNESARILEEFEPIEPEIVPKSHRQPRKQVFEKEEHESTVKLIEQLKLPEWNPTSPSRSSVDELLCRYCSEHNDRGDMVRVPRGEQRMLQWLDALGAEFGARLEGDEENYVCRAHFEKEAFSRTGRLLKGMVPNGREKVAVTYRIRGDHFMKLEEERTGHSATFDLEQSWSTGEQ